jgi:hypothetical protein
VTPTNWLRPVQKTREGGGRYWTNELYIGSREQLMQTMVKEMETFAEHTEHVIYHKRQMRDLLANFSQTDVIIKCDFIQNIVHSRGRETSQSFYSKRQTQFLSFVIWCYVSVNGVMKKKKLYVDYLSSYLKHNSLYFQKCLTHLLTYLRDDIGVEFRKVDTFVTFDPTPHNTKHFTQVWLDTDGGKAHFKCRFSFFFASTLPNEFGIALYDTFQIILLCLLY